MPFYLKEKPRLKFAATRDGFGEGLLEAGKKNKKIVALSADLTESTRCLPFKNKFPERFIQLGVSEQSMASIAAGLSLGGKIPFITSYAVFSPGRNWEQIRTCVALQKSNVKIVGSHAGLNVGADGASHQGKDEPTGHRDPDAAGTDQLQAGLGGSEGVFRLQPALPVHGSDQPAFRDYPQAPAIGARSRRPHARTRWL